MGDDGITRYLLLSTDVCHFCKKNPPIGFAPFLHLACGDCVPFSQLITPDSLIDDDTITEAQRELANREIPADGGP